MRTADGGERQFPLTKERMVIGRASRCDLCVPIPSVSQRHCEIIIESKGLRIVDLNSISGTYHNGSRIAEAELRSDDELTVGPTTFRVQIDLADARLEA
jgi:pSer/pThr/pTyr-binding forkhead associated (FHA) protein